ncbi:MAG: GNAT family N-acetyltransferase [Thermoanaerobaculia bacterium]|nr:GNAT family N-acetyltransferase [Thermoanaerobaculia bacterium]
MTGNDEIITTAVPGLTLRFGSESDVALVLQFIRELAGYERLAHDVVATEETLRSSLFGEPRRAEVVLAEQGGEPAGFALFFHNFSTFVGRPGLYLEDLFVRPAFRGHGIGRELLACLARIAVERDCGRFEWAVLDWNEPAIGFYKALGARPMNDWMVFRIDGDALRELAGPRGIR